jgi:flagellar hook-basal body complex protein FliE
MDPITRISYNDSRAAFPENTQGLHEIMIASDKARVQFTLLLNVRSKLLDSYQEVMRM